MCAPIPEGKWAWKYNACIECKTTEIKHKGRGLCLRCWDKERSKKPARKLVKLKASRRFRERNKWKEEYKKRTAEIQRKFYQKNKDNPEFRERIRQYNRKSYNKLKDTPEKKAKMLTWQRHNYLRVYYRKFLQGDEFYLKKYQGGIKIACEGCSKHCHIVSPVEIGKGKANMDKLQLFKKLVIKECNKKL